MTFKPRTTHAELGEGCDRERVNGGRLRPGGSGEKAATPQVREERLRDLAAGRIVGADEEDADWHALRLRQGTSDREDGARARRPLDPRWQGQHK